MNKINVLFLNKFREVGGSEVFLLELVRNLDRSKYRPVVTLVGETSQSAYELLEKEDVRVYNDLFTTAHHEKNGETNHHQGSIARLAERVISPQGRRSPYDVSAIFRLANILRDEHIHVLCYLDKHACLNLAPLAARLARTPVVVGSFHTPGLQFSSVERMLFPVTDQAVATSQYHKRYLEEVVGISPEKLKVINNGISLDRFEHLDANGVTRRDLGLSPDQPVVGILARLVPQKTHSVFLQAAARVNQVLPDAHFLIVGDGELRPELEAMSENLGLGRRVHFLGYRNDIGELLSLFDISALSSNEEFFPYTILESMLMSVPVVSTNVAAIPEMVEDGKTGLLVPPENPSALAGAILTLLTNRELAREMGQAGKQRVVDNFSSQKMTQQVEKMFEGILQTRRVYA